MHSLDIEDTLSTAAAALTPEPRVSLIGDWVRHEDRTWSLPVSVQLTANPTADMPRETAWHVVVSFSPDDDSVALYPDARKGITASFPHQLHNGPSQDRPWRAGKLCLDRPEAAFGRERWHGEPVDLVEKISWNVQRLLEWIDAAALGILVRTGDPIELPPDARYLAFPVVGFNETEDDLTWWTGRDERWGTATLLSLPGARHTSAVSVFHDERGTDIRLVGWGSWTELNKQTSPAIWIRLNKAPIVPPWRLPTFWAELRRLLAAEGIELGKILQSAGRHYRRSGQSGPYLLLLGFPLAEKVGEVARRMHWLCIDDVPLAGLLTSKKGFRNNEAAHALMDLAIAGSTSALRWIRSRNWAPDQLRTRSPGTGLLKDRHILIIGSGALGSAVADNLVRMGATRMSVMDGEQLEMGNFTRHVLGIEAAGHNKAEALAAALNLSMPDAVIRSIASSFPPAADLFRSLRDHDVVIDCTGSDSVLRSLSDFDWEGERLFVSLSVSWGGAGLFAYAAAEAMFPVVDAIERFNAAPAPPVEVDGAHEGIGCWHPVFPASADDVRLLASLGTRFLREVISVPRRTAAYFRLSPDGTVERVDV